MGSSGRMGPRVALALTLLASGSSLASPRFFVLAGLGFPELVHAEAGAFLSERVSLELQAGNILFNTEVGLGATAWLVGDAHGRPPRHSLLVHLQARFNPTPPIRLDSGGDRLGAQGGAYAGYGFLSDGGFLFRALVGVVGDWEGRPAFGPNLTLGAGWSW